MFKKFYQCISVFVLISLIISGCQVFGNPFVASPKIDRIIKSGDFVEDVELQTFPLFNCQSQVQNTLNVERSRTLERSVHLNVNITGETAQVKKLIFKTSELRGAVGGEYGWTNGTTITDTGGLLLNAAPHSYPIYTIAWRQRWEKGYIEVTGKDETEQIPYAFLSEAHPEIQDVSYVECTSVGFANATAIAQRNSSNTVNTPISPTDMPTPVFIQKISISSNSSLGVTFSAPQSGLYIFQYANGVASFCSTCEWGTNITAFRGAKMLWKDSTTPNFDASLFAIGDVKSTKQAAIDSAKDSKAAVRLSSGDQVTLGVIDSYYPDNVGDIELDVYFIP